MQNTTIRSISKGFLFSHRSKCAVYRFASELNHRGISYVGDKRVPLEKNVDPKASPLKENFGSDCRYNEIGPNGREKNKFKHFYSSSKGTDFKTNTDNDKKKQLDDIKQWFQKNKSDFVPVHKRAKPRESSHLPAFKKLGFKLQGECLYGIHPVLTALTTKRRHIYKLLVQRHTEFDDELPEKISSIMNLVHLTGIQIEEVPRHFLDKISEKRPHQGVCLDVSPLPDLIHDVSNSEVDTSFPVPLWLVLYKIKDPMNLGAILRSADYLCVDRVLRTTNDSCSLTPVVSKASSGAMEGMSLYTIKGRISDLIKTNKENGWKIVTTSAESRDSFPLTPIESFILDKPTLLVIGNEGDGIPKSIHQLSDEIITIQSPKVQDGCDKAVSGSGSLNVSVATGIILHSLLHCRSRKSK